MSICKLAAIGIISMGVAVAVLEITGILFLGVFSALCTGYLWGTLEDATGRSR